MWCKVGRDASDNVFAFQTTMRMRYHILTRGKMRVSVLVKAEARNTE